MPKRKANQSRKPCDRLIDFANDKLGILIPAKIDPTKMVEVRRWDTSKIPEARSNLKKFLESIIKTGKITDSKELRYFTNVCEQYVPQYEVEKGRLVKHFTISRTAPITLLFYPDWLRNLSFILVDYLLDPKTDLRKLKKCQQCEEYYRAERLIDTQKFCSEKCKRMSYWPPEKRNEYMRNYREKQKKEKEEIYYKLRIQRMLSGGHTREEAIEILEKEKKEGSYVVGER